MPFHHIHEEEIYLSGKAKTFFTLARKKLKGGTFIQRGKLRRGKYFTGESIRVVRQTAAKCLL